MVTIKYTENHILYPDNAVKLTFAVQTNDFSISFLVSGNH